MIEKKIEKEKGGEEVEIEFVVHCFFRGNILNVFEKVLEIVM